MRGTERPTRMLAAAFVTLALLLTGCARMPTDGPIEAGKGGNSEGGGGGQPPIQVFAQRPQKGWSQSQVVSGFLAAMASPEGNHAVARSYLTPDIRSDWPGKGEPAVVVYAQDEDYGLSLGRDDTVSVTAAQRATISNRGEYLPSPEGKLMHANFRLQQVGGEWRIGSLPGGLMMSASDVNSAYSPYDLFYFAKNSDTLVPAPVVLPANRDGLTADLVNDLIDGPPASVAPGVRSAIPRGTTLAAPPTVDEDGVLNVDLSVGGATVSDETKEEMIGQLTATLLRVEGVSEVSVDIDGDRSPAAGTSVFDKYEASRPVDARSGYFIRDGRLERVDPSSAKDAPLAGPFGTGSVEFIKPAVSLEATRAAAVSTDGEDLYTGPLDTKGQAVKLYDGTELSTPSWDRSGDLWVVDNTSSGPQLLRFADGKGEPQHVSASTLAGLKVRTLRVSWDGTRVALAVTGADGGELQTAVLDRSGDDIKLEARRQVAPMLSGVDDVWWYDRRSLAVAGREQSDLRAGYLVSVDGLTFNKVSSVTGLNGVAAAIGKPLLVSDTDGDISISQEDEFRSTTVGRGTTPIYPG